MNPAPILKWPGSKRARAAQLAGMFGDDRRPVYCEPFLGSGAVYLSGGLWSRYSMIVLGDATPRLIPTYRAVTRHPSQIAAMVAALPLTVQDANSYALTAGLNAPEDDRREGKYKDPWKAYFYHHRARLNAWVPVRGEVATPEHAAAFIWHRATAFNGLVRCGPRGDNTPAGVPAQGGRFAFPSATDLAAFSNAMWRALLTESDFEDTVRAVLPLGPADLFLDPPYSGDFDGYTPGGFKDADRTRMAGLVREVVAQGGRVVVTEADHPEARRWLGEAGLYVREHTGQTSISRSGDQRGKKKELIARSWSW